ncbi:MAG: N-acetylmuramoyl-L-alanine amidase, partial [Ruminococcus sp.]|nr:N-acetylmuramoyl-L-alanine amidase [Candidatus Copronaster equi]
HGGEDGGAVANDGSLEKDINLEIAKKLQNILNLYGVEVIMTRTSDISIYDDGITSIKKKKISDIHNRFKIIEENPNSLFVSIHQNKFQSEKQFGTQVFYSKNTASSKRLAQCIQESVVGSLQPENKRVVKPTGTEIYLLYHAHSTAVLVECGFVSNDEELSKLKDNDYQTAIAVSIANGIIKYSNDG